MDIVFRPRWTPTRSRWARARSDDGPRADAQARAASSVQQDPPDPRRGARSSARWTARAPCRAIIDSIGPRASSTPAASLFDLLNRNLITTVGRGAPRRWRRAAGTRRSASATPGYVIAVAARGRWPLVGRLRRGAPRPSRWSGLPPLLQGLVRPAARGACSHTRLRAARPRRPRLPPRPGQRRRGTLEDVRRRRAGRPQLPEGPLGAALSTTPSPRTGTC